MEANLTTTASTLIQTLSTVSFSWYDYILFTTMLLFSAMIGIYFGCFGSKQSTADEYLMGGKTMRIIPIAISLVASHTSGTTLLGLPADVYFYGAGYWLGGISMLILGVITIYVFLPVFFKLQLISTYEYLERRFDNRARLFASFLYTLSVFLYLPIVVYVPALAFSAATGVNVHYISPIVCGICIFYTTIGGLKAVVWTDTLQFSVTIGAVATVFILGVNSVGGFSNVWNKSVEGGRLDIFDFDPDPTKRETFWIVVVGLTFHWLAQISIHQTCVQKFLSVSNLRDSKKSVMYYVVGMTLMKTANVLTGFLMYAKYSDCDPFTTKQVTRNDQLLPYFVMDVARNVPGLSGLFIAGVFSAALSTLSANLNCLAGTIYEDFVSKFVSKDISQKSVSMILKLIVVASGVVCSLLVFAVEHMGGVLKLAISFNAVTQGPMLGMFTLGMLFPRANSKGAFYGGVIGLIFIMSIAFPAKYLELQGLFNHVPKPLSTEGCDLLNNTNAFSNSTIFDLTTPMSEALMNDSSSYQAPYIFRISYYYYSLLGCGMSVLVGLLISYMTNKDDRPVDRSLISPVCHFLLSEDSKVNGDVSYQGVEKALHTFTTNFDKENGKCDYDSML